MATIFNLYGKSTSKLALHDLKAVICLSVFLIIVFYFIYSVITIIFGIIGGFFQLSIVLSVGVHIIFAYPPCGY